jgi:outer membrane protein assembly factor BamB
MKKTAAATMLCVALLFSLFSIPFVGADWPMFHADPSRSGMGPSSPEVAANQWTYFVDRRGLSSPAVSDGVVYTASNSGIYALNASNGVELWKSLSGLGFDSSPAVVNGILYIGSDNVYALNATTGAQLWNYSTGSSVFSSPAVVNGIVYVGSSNALYALNAASGTRLWSFPNGYRIFSSPVVVNGFVYFGSLDNNVYALDASSGVMRWSFSTQDAVYASPAVADGVLYISSWDGNVYALNANTGVKLWSHAYGAPLAWTPAVANGMVYILNIEALNASTGVTIWNYATGGGQSTPAVVNGVVYIGSWDYNVYALNAFNGEKIWNYATNYYVDSSPAVAYGMVYIGSDDGNVYALKAAPPPTNTTIPKPPPTPPAGTASVTDLNGETIYLPISGDLTSYQLSDGKITTNQSFASTTVSFAVTLESESARFCNITIPKSVVPYGTIPIVKLDNEPAKDQGYTQDNASYHVWYTTSLSEYALSIVFSSPPRIMLLSPSSQTYNDSSISSVYTVDKPVNWTGYSLDGKENITLTGNFTLTDLSNGQHNLTVYANDTFGNMGESETVTFTVAVPEPFPVVPVVAVAVIAVAVALSLLLTRRKQHKETAQK